MIDLTKLPKNLPVPDAAMQAHSAAVAAMLCDEIERAGGAISFAHFMHLALYAPGLGYYSAGSRKFGEAGDFVTAPEISSLFSQCVARNCQQVLHDLAGGDILELGAGSGAMACDILRYLDEQGSLPQRYLILEVSADLRERQQAYLRAQLPQLFERIIWLDALPQATLRGVIIGNEVVDAMPVHLFRIHEQGQIAECDVAWRNGEFVFCERTITQGALYEHVLALKESLPSDTLYPGYLSEVNLFSQTWLQSLAGALQQGAILLIDYGFPRHEYYHPDRSMGTLMCHYRHHSHDNPLILLGLQDITAHVDFSCLAQAGGEEGLQLLGYTTQAQFLLASGLDALMAQSDPQDVRRHIALTQQVKKLVMPNEMGELFKAIAFGKGYEVRLPGFSQYDLSSRL